MSWNKLWLVLRREYLFNFKRPSFLFTAFGVPLITLVLMFIIFRIIANRETNLDEWTRVGFIDRAGVIDLAGPNPDNYFPVTIPRFDQPLEPDAAYWEAVEAHAARQLADGALDAYFVIADNYIMTGQVDLYAARNIPAALQERIEDFLHNQLAAQYDTLDLPVPAERLQNLSEITMRDIDTGREITETALVGRFLMPFIFVFLYFMATSTTAQFLMSGVVEEKENRLMEILATSVKPIELLWGKMIGLGALSLTQVAIWAAAGIAIATTNQDALDFVRGAEFQPGDILLTLVLFITNFMIFAAVMLGIGAAVTAEAESRQIAGFFTFIIVLPLALSGMFFNDPNGSLPVFFSLFPLTAAVGLILRLGLTVVPGWQIALSLGLQIVTVLAVMWLAAKVFRLGMLMYGKALTPRALWQALREGRTTLTTAMDETPRRSKSKRKGIFAR